MLQLVVKRVDKDKEEVGEPNEEGRNGFSVRLNV